MTTEQSTAVAAADNQTAVKKWFEAMPPELIAEAGMVVASGYYPTMKSVAQAAFKMWVADKLGFSGIEGLQFVHVIEPPANSSRPPSIVIGYPLVAARIQRSGTYDYRVESKTQSECRIGFYRLGHGGATKVGTSVFTIEDARRQGLIKQGGNWEKIPETMLFARALTNGAKTYCPSVLGGVEVNEDDGYVIESTAREVTDAPAETHGDEFAPDPWAAFWADVKALGWTKADVHRFAGVPVTDGALSAALAQVSEEGGKPVPELVAQLLDAIREEVAANTPRPVEVDDIPFDSEANDA